MQSEPNIGPIPKGLYEIGPPEDTSHEPYAKTVSPQE
jgi:hypothetical protein